MEPPQEDEILADGQRRPALTVETTRTAIQISDTNHTLASAVQEAADHVEVLVERASELLGESLDDSSLDKLAQLSKEMGAHQDHTLDTVGHGGNAEDDEGSESHGSGVHYVTAPSSPIIHVSAVAILGEETATTMSPSLSRRLSKDGTQHMGRKLRFTTITGEVEREGKGRRSLDVEFKDVGNRSDPGTPNLSET